MTIEYAILGLLSWKALSGYDLKKMIAESALYYWSGNNNQIYRSLIQLHTDGLVTQDVQQQEHLPARKIYAITPKGRERLREWVLANPQSPEIHNTFLLQLAWTDRLEDDELAELVDRYEQEVEYKMLMVQEQVKRDSGHPQRTTREAYLWDMIGDNLVKSYQSQLDWIRKLKTGLQAYRITHE